MSRDRHKLLERIRKCLRLSKSSNEHEAAAALRQARKLMDELQLSAAEVEALEASETRVRSSVQSRPSLWETALANTIARSTGCTVFFREDLLFENASWVYVGCSGRDQVANYAHVALMRKIKSARSDYIRTQLKRCGPRNRTARADMFCMGWIATVRSKVEPMVIAETDSQAMAAYLQRYNLRDLVPITRKPSSAAVSDDFVNGYRNGSAVDLRTPMSGGSAGPEALQ